LASGSFISAFSWLDFKLVILVLGTVNKNHTCSWRDTWISYDSVDCWFIIWISNWTNPDIRCLL
jgi:hypothetical protein